MFIDINALLSEFFGRHTFYTDEFSKIDLDLELGLNIRIGILGFSGCG